ncbi:Clr5 domain-containing protein [Neurospora tetraspora]|uniref:Clr5 domain-containing protein n=1 Tax=Neurospora tetraspora TaxID=94610 RepID=A0AAE0JDP9_9PEZI|nr:Clr5 domain-containing protein [Neurospora tetraspora]
MTKQWEDHRHIIIREYRDNNKPLHEVKKFMEERYRFKASIRAYRSRFDRWRVRKYTCRKRRDSFGGKSESSDDSTGCSPPPRSPIRSRRVSSSPQEHSSIHYIGSSMYESTTPAEDFLTPPIFEPRQLYHTDPLAGLLPASGLHSSQGGLVNSFRYPPDHQGQCATGIYPLVHDPVFQSKFIKGCSQPLLDHCFSDRVANRFPRPIQ